MDVFEFVLLIVFLGIAGSILNKLINLFAHRKDGRKDEASFGEAEELRDQILTLEDRIRVLERIVTESSPREDLRRQFRELER